MITQLHGKSCLQRFNQWRRSGLQPGNPCFFSRFHSAGVHHGANQVTLLRILHQQAGTHCWLSATNVATCTPTLPRPSLWFAPHGG